MDAKSEDLMRRRDEPCWQWVWLSTSGQDEDRCVNCGYSIDEHRAHWASAAA